MALIGYGQVVVNDVRSFELRIGLLPMTNAPSRDEKMAAIAFALGIPRDELRRGSSPEQAAEHVGHDTRQALDLLRAFNQIESARTRCRIVRLVETIIAEER